MSKIAVVIPTYNRKNILALTLVGLVNQTVHDFEIVICDDGSTDGTHGMVMGFHYVHSAVHLKYYWHKHEEGVERQVSLARNQGARLVAKETTHILFLDGEVVLNPQAIENYYELIAEKPGVVICGRYDWLPPMEIDLRDIRLRWDDFISANLPRLTPEGPRAPVGKDFRGVVWDDGVEHEVFAGAALSGNLLIPIEAFYKTGGFDEDLKERGQDCEHGYALQFAGFKAIFTAKTIGYHVNHPAAGSEGRLSEIRAIRYIHAKYDIPLDEKDLPPVI